MSALSRWNVHFYRVSTVCIKVCLPFQIMISTAATFLYSVLTIYTYCKLIRKHDDYHFSQQLLWLQTAWLLYYSGGTCILIYHINLLSNEVNGLWILKTNGKLVFLTSLIINSSQGKRTFHIVHDIINCCHDAELMLSVCIPRMYFKVKPPWNYRVWLAEQPILCGSKST